MSVICSIRLIKLFGILNIQDTWRVTGLKYHVGLTMDAKLFREIEDLRGREKRSTFIEHLIKLGLKTYSSESKNHSS
jgi:hypothetical protein